MAQIGFRDELGVRWTVTIRPAPTGTGGERRVYLQFTNEAGAQRRYEAFDLPRGQWDDVDENVWRALLGEADTNELRD